MFKRYLFVSLIFLSRVFSQNIDYSRIRNGPGLSVLKYGALANNTTSQTASFQAAADAVSAAGGGSILIPYSPNCYMLGGAGVLTHSKTTWYSDSVATCVKVMDGATHPAFYTDPLAATSGVHWKNFTIDGNRAAMTGIVGDGGNYGIVTFGCSDCSIEGMMILNPYTDGIGIECYGSPQIQTGSGFLILNTWVLNARRNGGSQTCGLNTTISHSHFNSTNGTNPEAGFDLEPFLSTQVNSGFQIIGQTEFTKNNAQGILLNYTGAADSSANFMIDANVYGNCLTINVCAELYAVAFNNQTGLTVTGNYTATNTSSIAAILVNGGFTNVTIAANGTGTTRGLLLGNVNTNVILGPGMLKGSLYDISADATNVNVTMAGVTFAHGLAGVQTGGYQLPFQLAGWPLNFAANGVCFPPTIFNTTISCSQYVTLNSSATNPALALNDGTGNIAAFTLVNNSGVVVHVGAVSAISACLTTNNTCRVTVDSSGNTTLTGTFTVGSVPVYANNAAAIAGGLAVGGVYRITGADTMGVVH